MPKVSVRQSGTVIVMQPVECDLFLSKSLVQKTWLPMTKKNGFLIQTALRGANDENLFLGNKRIPAL